MVGCPWISCTYGFLLGVHISYAIHSEIVFSEP
uniref:Ycf1 n=1 Tax=Acrostichum speciosum TaxID=366450 RepID=A0A7M1VIX1_9MONI|nr:Ycf1 [Acrostichum speciosum]QOS04131.1 Ycf1 [Acrostichum speciosum]